MTNESKKEWRLLDDVKSWFKNAGFQYEFVASGNSPYSSFDIIFYKDEEFKLGITPALYTVSDMEIKSDNPAEAYKGRHARGRLIVAKTNDDGLVSVCDEYAGDTTYLELANGLLLGKKAKITIGDLFPEGFES